MVENITLADFIQNGLFSNLTSARVFAGMFPPIYFLIMIVKSKGWSMGTANIFHGALCLIRVSNWCWLDFVSKYDRVFGNLALIYRTGFDGVLIWILYLIGFPSVCPDRLFSGFLCLPWFSSPKSFLRDLVWYLFYLSRIHPRSASLRWPLSVWSLWSWFL